MSQELPSAQTEPGKPANPQSDKIVGILATVVYGVCCVFQGFGIVMAAFGTQPEGAPEITATQQVLVVASIIVTIAAVGSGILVSMSRQLGFRLGVGAMIATIAINVVSIMSIPEQSKNAAEAAAKQASGAPPVSAETIAMISYTISAFVILINVLYLAYCASRMLSKKLT
ncbi:MAG: hypothetical protein KIT74_05910 [Fimbriimonadales bacterium]|nr:hypothetical protein [Fimbriimonadales bacterium]